MITHFSSVARVSEITLRYSVSSDETSKICLFRWAPCNQISSASQVCSSRCFSFFDEIESNRVNLVGQPCHSLESKTFSNDRSACARKRYRCLFLFASSYQRVSLEWETFFLPECPNFVFLTLFHFTQGFPLRALRRVGLRKIEEFERSVCTWKQQFFLSNSSTRISGTVISLEVFAIHDWHVTCPS